MPIKKLKETDIDELIRMVDVIHGQATKEIMPILQNLQNGKNVKLTIEEESTLERWSTDLEDLTKGDTHKAAKCLVWIVRKWHGR